MARPILIGLRDFVPGLGTFSGGSWSTGLPLVNLVDLRPQFVAEALTTAAASSTFDVDLGAAFPLGTFFFANLTVTQAATIRLRAGTDATFAVNLYDTGTVSAWPTNSLAQLYGVNEWVALGRPRWFIPPAPVTCRYIRVNIDDSASATRVRIGCFGACQVWEPTINFAPGWQLDVIDESDVQRVPYGSTYITQRGIRRRLNLGFPSLDEFVFLNTSLGLSLRSGRSLPLVVVPFPDDTPNLERTAIYGTISRDGQMRNSLFRSYEHLFQIDQLI